MADTSELTFTCPACGYPSLSEAPWTDESGGSLEICPCCGIQFGYVDVFPSAECRPALWHGWGVKWFTDGMHWGSSTPPPEGWDPEAQFKSRPSSN